MKNALLDQKICKNGPKQTQTNPKNIILKLWGAKIEKFKIQNDRKRNPEPSSMVPSPKNLIFG